MTAQFQNRIGKVCQQMQVMSRGYPYLVDGKSYPQWWCKCLVCGDGFLTRSCYAGKRKLWENGCPRCSYEHRTKLIRKGKGYAGLNILYLIYKGNASKMDREFSLTIEEFKEITQRDCTYCGIEPIQISRPPLNNGRTTDGVEWASYIYNGVDRVDNDIGYTIQNSVPCCGVCNLMKRSMGVEVFLKHIKKIATFSGLFELATTFAK